MSNKKNKCKGTHHTTRGIGCGEFFYKRTYGLCLVCLRDWATNTEEGKKWLKKQTAYKMKSNEKEKKRKNKEYKEKHKSIAALINEARKPFQKWIRYRDANKPCISCGVSDSAIWDGGHLYKAELYSGLIFDERNVNKQCRKCNNYLGGNENNYRVGFISRYGESILNGLDIDAINKRSYKYSREELLSIKKEYQRRLNNLK